jgi:CBS domain-containing protein
MSDRELQAAPGAGARGAEMWRASFLSAGAHFLQRAAEMQAFDNPALVAATCLVEGMSKVIPRARHRKQNHIVRRRLNMLNTCVKELMEDKLIMIDPEATLCEAARKMKETNCGSLVVGSGNKPDGIITDRDIVIRAVSRDCDPADEQVRDHMTGFVMTCNVNDTLTQAADIMREHAVSRLVVTDEDGRACGLISFGRILRNHDDAEEIAAVVACVTGRKNIFAARKALTDAATRAH